MYIYMNIWCHDESQAILRHVSSIGSSLCESLRCDFWVCTRAHYTRPEDPDDLDMDGMAEGLGTVQTKSWSLVKKYHQEQRVVSP